MAIVQCLNNHYYDDKRNATCPYCEKMGNAVTGGVTGFNEQLTSYLDIPSMDDAQMTEAYGESVAEYEKTIGIFVDETNNLLTAAWLVCVAGAQKGKSYTVYAGRNFAGRAPHMDIVLADDNEIAREQHFSIVYDPKSVMFYLVSGAGRTYVNGESVSEQVELHDGDSIQVGQSRYTFVPFCKKGREWT